MGEATLGQHGPRINKSVKLISTEYGGFPESSLGALDVSAEVSSVGGQPPCGQELHMPRRRSAGSLESTRPSQLVPAHCCDERRNIHRREPAFKFHKSLRRGNLCLSNNARKIRAQRRVQPYRLQEQCKYQPPPENSQLCQPVDTRLCSIRLP